MLQIGKEIIAPHCHRYSWLRSLCYSAGRLSSKLPEQICSYITNVYLQHSAGYGQDSAGCIATNFKAL